MLHIVKTVVGATWALRQVRVLRSLGIDVVVALPSDSAGLASKYREAGAALVPENLDFPAGEPWRIPAVLSACRRVVQQVRPDLIHSHHVGTTMVMRMAIRRDCDIPRIFQVPGPLHLEHRFFARAEVALSDSRDYWIAGCEWTQQKYKQMGIPKHRLFLSYYGTEIAKFCDTPTGRLRRELQIPPDVPLVGMVAYMYPPKWFLGQTRGLKGHEDFISALVLARKTNPEIRGVIIGGAWNHADWYERRLRAIGSRACGAALTFLGTRDDVAELYPDLDLAVIPSHSENLGASAEALLSGVPVMATNVGGLPDLVHDSDVSPKTGWLVTPKSPKQLAEAILHAVANKDEARRRAREGQALARRLLDVEITGREIATIYESILADRKVRPNGPPLQT